MINPVDRSQPHEIEPETTQAGSLDDVRQGGGELAEGARGEAVVEMQRALTKAGFPLADDGIFGPKTHHALLEFQAAHGIEQTGRLGPTTLSFLDRVGHAPVAGLDAVKAGKAEIGLGQRGTAVADLQARLGRLGFPVHGTGVFGTATENALQAFQRAHGVETTGRLGKTTLHAIELAEANPRQPGPAPLPRPIPPHIPLHVPGHDPVPHTPTTHLDPIPGTRTTAPTEHPSVSAALAEMSPRGKQQMASLLEVARKHASGKRPDHNCYGHVADYLGWAGGYGNMPTRSSIPGNPLYARYFADFMNQGNNAAKYGLRKLDIQNPYDAPPGAIIVVPPHTPGTGDPVAGDIVVKGTGDHFYNGGEMGYGGRQNFPPHGSHVPLGIYVPV